MVYLGTGRRKQSTARVRLTKGTGKITVNGTPLEDYLPLEILVMDVRQPYTLTDNAANFDATIRVNGGGFSGQAGAMRLGIARALLVYNPELRKILKPARMLTRDAKIKERKKYGLKKARKAPQFSKR